MHCYLIATDIGIGHARIAMLIYLKMLKHTAVLAETEVIMEIAKIDINFQLKNCRDRQDLVFYDAADAPFQIYGLYGSAKEIGYRRMPEAAANAVNPGVKELSAFTAGGRLRFLTDSGCIAIFVKEPGSGHMAHMPLLGSSGFDLYEETDTQSHYLGSLIPPTTLTDGYDAICDLGTRRMRDITLYFPLYNGVQQLMIGLESGAALKKPIYRYAPVAPIVYYGSSITQGGCASRPGNAYQSMILRRNRIDYINLGFSGSAKGETAMADYITSLSMSALVYDYDHNAPDESHLKQTHEAFFLRFRQKQPNTPVIMISKPDFWPGRQDEIRRSIIQRTYQNAIARGDRHVYMIDGETFFPGELRDLCMVDGCHPNDLGFYQMANRIERILNEAL